MERQLIKTLGSVLGKEVTISGWVEVRRDHGKLIFLVIRDRSGEIQTVVNAKNAEAFAVAGECRSQWVISMTGIVQERRQSKDAEQKQDLYELSVSSIQILSKAEPLPFELDADLNIDTYFDHLPLTLRRARARHTFKVACTIVDAFREALRQNDFTEFQAPAIVGQDAEGGAAVFKIGDYFGKSAYLATSAQLYKQIMVGPFERASTIAKTFRAEKSATTRHLSEITQLEFEMGFINNHHDVMAMHEKVIRHIVKTVAEKHADAFDYLSTPVPLLSERSFPELTLPEAQEILEREYNISCRGAKDLDPEHERKIAEWAQKEKGSDFIFITRFPTKARAFYTYADPEDPAWSNSFDLLFRGLEITSGAQRIHDYGMLVAKMQERGMNPEKFSFYLEAFKYGLPPHGGCSTGLERITARMLDLPNVKEATPFPRDMTRVDVRISEE